MDPGIPIKEIMTTDILTVSKNDTIGYVKNQLLMNHIHHIPVVAGKRILGIISLSDIHMMEHHFTLFHTKTSEEINKDLFSTILASEIMTKEVVKVREDEPVSEAVNFFRENIFHALPVVDASGNLAGMLTPFDLIRYAYDPIKSIQEKY